MQKPNNNLTHYEVPMDATIDKTMSSIENKLNRLTIDGGILFITDIYGSTPSNIAQRLATRYHADLISGVNLPMIIRLLSYRNEPEQELLQKSTGRRPSWHKALC
jgi:PTS system ascorbate-specific IIA component